jgi:hypothetical protein
MKGTIIPITFVATTKEQVRDEKKIFLNEDLSKKLIAKKILIIKKR